MHIFHFNIQIAASIAVLCICTCFPPYSSEYSLERNCENGLCCEWCLFVPLTFSNTTRFRKVCFIQFRHIFFSFVRIRQKNNSKFITSDYENRSFLTMFMEAPSEHTFISTTLFLRFCLSIVFFLLCTIQQNI